MNLRTQKVAAKPPARRRGKSQKSLAGKFYVLMYLLVVCAVFFGVMNYRIDLNRKISNLQRLSNRTKQEIYELERDIKALKIEHNRLCSWENVRGKIAEYKLPFRASTPRQVRSFAVRHRNFHGGQNSNGGNGNAVSLSQANH